MPLLSLGLASDVMVLGQRSTLEEHDDRFILRSPDEPDFWFGNMVIFRDDHVDPEMQIAAFQKDFPEAGHVTLAWDIPNMGQDERFEPFKALGFEIDHSDVLVLKNPLNPSDPPAGITVRALTTDDDWEQATKLQGVTGVEQGHDAAGYLPYIKTRMKTCRRLTEEGLGIWFGAFSGDELVGDLGIYSNEQTARFQAVEIRKDYRRRGICASMVTAGVEWARARYPVVTPVIIADKESAAGRIYRRCGFELSEQLIAVYRGPKPEKAGI